MYSEKGESFTIEENVGETIYNVEKTPSGHIPKARLIYKNEQPVFLKSEEKKYSVEATEETITAKTYFTRDTQYYPDGNIKSIEFRDKEASDYFNYLLQSLRLKQIMAAYEAALTDIKMEQMTKPGKLEKTPGVVIDILENKGQIYSLFRGEKPSGIVTEALKMAYANSPFAVKNNPFILEGTKLNFTENEAYPELIQETLDFIYELENGNIPVTKHNVTIELEQGPINIKRSIIGQLSTSPKQKYLIEERVAEKFLFAKNVLHKTVPSEVSIFDTQYYSPEVGKRFANSKATHFIGSIGKALNNKYIYLSPHSKRSLDKLDYDENTDTLNVDYHIEVTQDNVIGTADHEAAHIIDTNVQLATRPQAEGFARSIDNGLRFTKTLDRLRGKEVLDDEQMSADMKKKVQKMRYLYYYDNEITTKKMMQIFSSKPPHYLNNQEIYDIPATFYSWIYEQLGPEAFSQFHDDITGKTEEGNQVVEYLESLAYIKSEPKLKGRLLSCINNLRSNPNWYWNDAKSMLEDYLNAVNRKKTNY
jgi:hypothetical protein